MGFTVHEDTALQVENEVELPVHEPRSSKFSVGLQMLIFLSGWSCD